MIVWLKYRQKGATLGTTTAMRFDALTGEDLPDAEHKQQRGLRRIDYQHLLSTRSAWDIAIGADELYDPTKRAFMEEFWVGAQKWLVFDSATDEPDAEDFTEITTPSGRIPFQSIEGSWDFVTFASTFTAKHPD